MNANQKDLVVAGAVGLIELPRIVDAYMALHGGAVSSDLWPAAHGVSGVGLVLVGAWVAERAVASLVTAETRDGDWKLLRNATVVFILAALVTMLPPMISRSFLAQPEDAVSVAARALWALAAVVGPLALVVMSPMASRLAPLPARAPEAQRAAFALPDEKPAPALPERAPVALPARQATSGAERARAFRERQRVKRAMPNHVEAMLGGVTERAQ